MSHPCAYLELSFEDLWASALFAFLFLFCFVLFVFRYIPWLFSIYFLVHLSFLPFSQVMGLVPRRCRVHRHFPAMPRSRAKRPSSLCPGQAVMGSATAPASFNDSQRATATGETVCPDLLVGSLHPLPPGRPTAVKIETGQV